MKELSEYIIRILNSFRGHSCFTSNASQVFYAVMLVLFTVPTSTWGQNYRMMTYNIRFDNPNDTPHTWDKRWPLITKQLQQIHVDIVGFQEALHHQVLDLSKSLKEFDWVGQGRDDGQVGGEFSPILYKRDKFELQNFGTIWLSETPSVPSVGWDAVLPRIATWVVLKDKKSAKSFLVINTHFDHVGVQSRQKSLSLLRDFATQDRWNSYPLILMGDFNLADTDPVWTDIGSLGSLKDAYHVATDRKGPKGTFNAFNWEFEGSRIDYILTDSIFKVSKYEVIKSRSNKKILPSDHWPIWVEVAFE